MTEGHVRTACRRIAARSYRRRRAELWATVYCTAFDFDVEGNDVDASAVADDGSPKLGTE